MAKRQIFDKTEDLRKSSTEGDYNYGLQNKFYGFLIYSFALFGAYFCAFPLYKYEQNRIGKDHNTISTKHTIANTLNQEKTPESIYSPIITNRKDIQKNIQSQESDFDLFNPANLFSPFNPLSPFNSIPQN